MLLAHRPDLLERVTAEDILTPHPGEAAALLGCTAAQVQAQRHEALHRLCALCRGVIVLKGAGTLVGQHNAPTLLCPYDVPQLAVGGSGDVLAGCIGGLLASRFARLEQDNPAAGVLAPAHLLAGQGVALHGTDDAGLGIRYCAVEIKKQILLHRVSLVCQAFRLSLR